MPLRAWRGHRGPVTDLVTDASGGLLASAGADRAARVWDADGFFCTHVFHGHQCAKRSDSCSRTCLWLSRGDAGVCDADSLIHKCAGL